MNYRTDKLMVDTLKDTHTVRQVQAMTTSQAQNWTHVKKDSSNILALRELGAVPSTFVL